MPIQIAKPKLKYKVKNNIKTIPENISFDDSIEFNTDTIDKLYDFSKYLDSILIKNKIEYSLFNDSVLGYEVHRGLIPWSKSISLCISKTDYDELSTMINIFNESNTYEWIDVIVPGIHIYLRDSNTLIGKIYVLDHFKEERLKYSFDENNIINKYFNILNVFPPKRGRFEDFQMNVPSSSYNLSIQLFGENRLNKCYIEETIFNSFNYEYDKLPYEIKQKILNKLKQDNNLELFYTIRIGNYLEKKNLSKRNIFLSFYRFITMKNLIKTCYEII